MKARTIDFAQHVSGSGLFLKDMDLEDNDIPGILSYLNSHPEIKKLDLTSNKIGLVGAELLAGNMTLHFLDLSHNSLIGDDAAKALAEHKTLKKLALEYCDIGDEGAIALANCNHFKWLHLTGNKIGDKGANAFAFADNAVLRTLSIMINNISRLGVEALKSNKAFYALSTNCQKEVVKEAEEQAQREQSKSKPALIGPLTATFTTFFGGKRFNYQVDLDPGAIITGGVTFNGEDVTDQFRKPSGPSFKK